MPTLIESEKLRQSEFEFVKDQLFSFFFLQKIPLMSFLAEQVQVHLWGTMSRYIGTGHRPETLVRHTVPGQ